MAQYEISGKFTRLMQIICDCNGLQVGKRDLFLHCFWQMLQFQTLNSQISPIFILHGMAFQENLLC